MVVAHKAAVEDEIRKIKSKRGGAGLDTAGFVPPLAVSRCRQTHGGTGRLWRNLRSAVGAYEYNDDPSLFHVWMETTANFITAFGRIKRVCASCQF